MDDLMVVREFRAEAPEADRGRMAAIRPDWNERTAVRPHRGFATRLALTGAFAVAAAVVAMAVIVVTSPEPGHVGTTGRPPVIAPVSVTTVLDGLANSAQGLQRLSPRPNQWVYVQKALPHYDGTGKVTYPRTETWWRADGKLSARRDAAGAIVTTSAGLEGDDRSVLSWQAYTESLPSEPRALLDRLYRDGGTTDPAQRDEKAFTAIVGLMGGALLAPPSLNAELLRTVALLPDVRMTEDVVDVAGRHGVGFSRARADGTREELILDPSSGAYLGFRSVVEDATRLPHVGRGLAPRNGDVLHAEARIAVKVVDRAGQRP